MKTNNHLNININNEMFINQPYLCINVLINDNNNINYILWKNILLNIKQKTMQFIFFI
jgi:hypothetical protein